jgi:hypothetical protein
VACLLAALQASADAPGDASPAWSRLLFTHESLALGATLTVERDAFPASALPAAGWAHRDALAPSGAAVGRLRVISDFRLSALLQRRRESVLWFDMASHAALRGMRYTSGLGSGSRFSRYLQTGVQVDRSTMGLSPGAEPLAGGHLSGETTLVSYGAMAAECSAITEPIALLLLDPAWLRDPASGAGLCVISHKRLFRAIVSEPVEEELRMHYRVFPDESDAALERQLRALRYTLRLHALDQRDGGSETESFPGFRGALDIHVDARSAMPLRLRGRVIPLGKVELQLREVWLAPAPSLDGDGPTQDER